MCNHNQCFSKNTNIINCFLMKFPSSQLKKSLHIAWANLQSFLVLKPGATPISRWGEIKTGEPRENPPVTPASRTWLVSHVARAWLEPTPDTAVT